MPRISKTPEERRREIVETAARLFTERGYAATAVSDIAKRLGVAQGTVYYHFRSKAEVLDAVLDRLTEGLAEALRSIAERRDSNEVAKLAEMGRRLADSAAANHELVAFLSSEGNESLHEQVRTRLLARLVPILETVIESGVKARHFDVPHPAEAVQVLVALVSQFAKQGRAFHEPERLAKVHQTLALAATRFLGIRT